MSYVGGQISCKGKWAMSDADHTNPVLTSDFEFFLVEPEDESTKFPRNGRYQGWFHIKQPLPLKPLKVEDKDMVMKFSPDADDSYLIQGQGHNVYGKFNLRGTLSKEGSAHIYREYYHLNPVPLTVTTPHHGRRPAERRESIEKKKSLDIKAELNNAPSSSGTPRESSGRTRKPSTLMQESIAASTPKAQTPKELISKAALATSAPPSLIPPLNIRQSSGGPMVGERSHRLNPAFKRCSELLKEMSKLPQSVWFLEPVDPIKFNIPDYPKIIKNPMDFSTIKSNIENGMYESVEEFANHMRLVFRNAVTFNTDKESMVHIAAKDVGNRFEDRFKQLLSQISPDYFEPEPTPKSSKSGGTSSSSKVKTSVVKTPREHQFAEKEPLQPKKKTIAAGPRPSSQGAFIPPAAVDQGTLMILEMQKKMETMEQELHRLRATVQENQLKDRVEESVEAAKKPLTLDEKRALVTQIYKLAPEKIEKALDIIRESIATNPDDGEIEIPIDSLDTLTLRKLQKFIQDNTEKKKRSLGAPSLSRQPSVAKGEPAPKKAKKTSKSSNLTNSGGLLGTEEDLALFDEHEPLLFENEQLDSTPLQSHSSGFVQHSFNDDDDDDDGNKWEQAIQEDQHDQAIV